MGLLRLYRHGRDRAGNQAAKADRLTGNLAEAVFAFLDPFIGVQRAIDVPIP